MTRSAREQTASRGDAPTSTAGDWTAFMRRVPYDSPPVLHWDYRRMLLAVWDGMRPYFASPETIPALAALAQSGVRFRNRPVCLSTPKVHHETLHRRSPRRNR